MISPRNCRAVPQWLVLGGSLDLLFGRIIVVPYTRLPCHVAALFALATFVGCQSGVERDIVQREMRQQEDQIYALEDYLSEYQQLLCDARSENAQLKRQLVQGQFRDVKSSEKRDESDSLPTPSKSMPSRPADSGPPARVPEVIEPEVPSLDLSEPAVPPLDDTSSIEADESASEIEHASAEVDLPTEMAAAVVLSGEVRPDEAKGGPRVLLQVKPMSSDGEPARFDGKLSLLVLDPAAREKEQQLARWDFRPEELRLHTSGTRSGTSFEFPLQLPAEAPTDRPLELWVRLLPKDGKKLLGRTTLDLGQAGRFASAEVEPTALPRSKVEMASAELPVEPTRRKQFCETGSAIQRSGWQTARPGEIAQPQAAGPAPASEWKMATRPVPEVESTPSYRELPAAEGDRYEVAAAADWSPERPEDDRIALPQEPAWSPTR